ncbi:MAG: DUF3256 family protein [Dysgonomonas sp.]|nr:DUF3256 family protein [Dysgonomonas sp.]
MKHITTILFAFFLGAASYAQDSLSSLVISMPESMLIGVSAEQKNELVTTSDTAEVAIINAINEKVERTAFSDDYIALKTSDAGTLQIKLLPLVNNSNIIGVITTVCGRACDSRIDFYTTSWELLPTQNMFPAKNKEWFIKSDIDKNSEDFRNAIAALDFNPIKLSFSPDNYELKADYDIMNYLSAVDYKLIEPFLIKESKTFHWDKQSFK